MMPVEFARTLTYNFNPTIGSFKIKIPTQSFKPKTKTLSTTNTTKLAINTKQKQYGTTFLNANDCRL